MVSFRSANSTLGFIRVLSLFQNFFEQLYSEAFHESNIVSESFLDDLDEINLQKRKLEDDLNDIYHERIRINQTEDKVDGN